MGYVSLPEGNCNHFPEFDGPPTDVLFQHVNWKFTKLMENRAE